MNEFNKKLAATLVILLIIICVLALETYIVMVVWNNVITKKFPDANIQELNFWEALGLMVLISLLFPHTVIYSNSFARKLNNM